MSSENPYQGEFAQSHNLKITSARQRSVQAPTGGLRNTTPRPSGRLNSYPYTGQSGKLPSISHTGEKKLVFSNENDYSEKPEPPAPQPDMRNSGEHRLSKPLMGSGSLTQSRPSGELRSQPMPQTMDRPEMRSESLRSAESKPTPQMSIPTPATPNQPVREVSMPKVEPPKERLNTPSSSLANAIPDSFKNDVVQKYNELRKEAERVRRELSLLTERMKTLEKQSGGERDKSLERFTSPPESSELPVSLNDLLKLQVSHNGTDLHIKVGAPPMLRIDGDLVQVGDKPITENDANRLLIPLLEDKNKKELIDVGETEFSIINKIGRFHPHIYLQKNLLSASIRHAKTKIRSLITSGVPASIIDSLPLMSGLLLVSGVKASGKSSTIAAIANHINKTQKLHIVTVENPINYIIEDVDSIISQKEVGTDIKSIAHGIKSAIRQDADVIVLDELNNHEEAYEALKAAECGRLVIAAIKASNTVHSILKFINLFPISERDEINILLSETLSTALSLKLIPGADLESQVLATEILNITPLVAPLIASANYNEIYRFIQDGSADGMMTFNNSIASKLAEKLITKDCAMAYSDDPGELAGIIAKMESN